jgi:Calx-beta domain/Beta-propeller repeat
MKCSRGRRARLLAAVLAFMGLMNGFTWPVSAAGREQRSDLYIRAASHAADVSAHSFVGNTARAVKPASLSKPATPEEPARARIAADYGRVPLSFEANGGQFDSQVKFVSRGIGYNLFLTSTAAVLALHPSPQRDSRAAQPRQDTRAAQVLVRPPASSAVVRMRLVGANTQALVSGEEKSSGRVNYLIGSDRREWKTALPVYNRVSYKGVYRGIDLVYYGNQSRLEYDFVVEPGADPGRIRLAFDGVDGREVDGAGNLVMHLDGGVEVRQQRPFVYQEVNGQRREVACRYLLLPRGEVGFRLGEYDGSLPLVIDPVLVYASYFGGGVINESYGIAVDAQGSAYVTGLADSVDFPTTPGAFLRTRQSGDAFVTKLTPDGRGLVYSTYLGGEQGDFGEGIAVDAAGNAYVAGWTSSKNLPVRNAFQASHRGGVNDAFLMKLNAAGSDLLYATYLGGSGFDLGLSLAIDSSGNAYLTGRVESRDFPTTQGALRTTSDIRAPYGDGFVTKINTNATGADSLVYSTYYGAPAHTGAGWGIAADSSGNAYVAAGDSVSKLNAAGTQLLYFFRLSDAGPQSLGAGFAGAVAVDSAGNAYVTGTTSAGFRRTPNGFQESYGGGAGDAFVLKLNASGTEPLYLSLLGGGSYDVGNAVAVDSAGNAYVTGYTHSTDFPVRDAVQAAKGRGSNAFVTKIDTTTTGANSLIYSTYYGVNNNETGSAVAVDASGNAYVTGFTYTVSLGGIIHTGRVFTPGEGNNGTISGPFVIKIGSNATASTLQLSAAVYTANEGDGRLRITVTRTGDIAGAASVSYATIDDSAGNRSDYNTAVGTLHFAPGETARSFDIFITDDAYVEGGETLKVVLGNQSAGAALGNPFSATINVTDNDAAPAPNPIDDVDFLIRQHYVDFLNREPDAGGYDAWKSILNNCPQGDTRCDEIEVSSAFFRSPEFRERGYFVYKFYAAALGRLPHYDEFMTDLAQVSGFQTPEQQEAGKVAFINDFISRPEFRKKYDALDNFGYVDTIIATAGVSLGNHQALIDSLNQGRKTRAQVLREIAQSAEVDAKFFNEAFVVMQYFGYLRRDPDALYRNWIETLNTTGDYRLMVNGFLNSAEYRFRFGR